MREKSLPEQWNDREFANNYLQTADITVVGRQRSIEILKSFYLYFVASKEPKTVIDLGCGDGILAYELIQTDNSLSSILVDGSPDMLEQARKRFEHISQPQYLHASFQEIISGEVVLPENDLVVSSLAIHHLSSNEKQELFHCIYTSLNKGGYFINIDTVRSSFTPIDGWYLKLWRDQVFSGQTPRGYEQVFEKILSKYISEEHYCNVDTLESQMHSLTKARFSQVDCLYRNGMFAIYCGIKPD